MPGGGEDHANFAEASVCLQGPEPGQAVRAVSAQQDSRGSSADSRVYLCKGFGSGPTSANGGQLPPAALVASKALAKDPRGEPKHGERVRYVVTHGQPGARLIDMVFSPGELIESRGSLRLHARSTTRNRLFPRSRGASDWLVRTSPRGSLKCPCRLERLRTNGPR